LISEIKLTWFATNWKNADSQIFDNTRTSASPLDGAFPRQPQDQLAVALAVAARRVALSLSTDASGQISRFPWR
jgi:hypothetical protein